MKSVYIAVAPKNFEKLSRHEIYTNEMPKPVSKVVHSPSLFDAVLSDGWNINIGPCGYWTMEMPGKGWRRYLLVAFIDLAPIQAVLSRKITPAEKEQAESTVYNTFYDIEALKERLIILRGDDEKIYKQIGEIPAEFEATREDAIKAARIDDNGPPSRREHRRTGAGCLKKLVNSDESL